MSGLRIWGLGLLLGFVCQFTQAGVIAGWEFNNSGSVYSATETIQLSATFYNSSESTGSLDLSSIYGAVMMWNFETVSAYRFSFGDSGNLFGQFAGVSLAPGESMDFVFGELKPRADTVEDGSYSIFGAGMFTRGFRSFFLTGGFDFSVVSAITALTAPVVEVKEAGLLFGFLVGFAFLFRRVRSKTA